MIFFFTWSDVLKIHPCEGIYLRLNNIPLCVCNTFYLCIHPSVDMWVPSTFWLLWIILHMNVVVQISLGDLTFLEVKFLGHIVILF